MIHNKKRLIAKVAPLTTAIAAAMLTTQAAAVDFHGYARSGLSTNLSNGGEQTCLGGKLSGRLGDECDTYAELALGQELYNKDDQSFRIDSMVSLNAPNQGNDYQAFTGTNTVTGVDFNNNTTTTASSSPYSGGELALRQLYVSGKNVVALFPGATLWAGKRYYQRHNIDQIDFYYLNDSGYGAGVENITAGVGKLSVAWMNNDTTQKDAFNNNNIVQNNKLDVRYAFPVSSDSTLDLAAIYGMADRTQLQKTDGLGNKNGFFLSSELSTNIMGGFNKFVLQYGQDSMGDAAYYTSGGTSSNYLSAGSLKHSWRVIDHGVIALSGPLQMGYSAMYEKGKANGTATKEDPATTSVVVRPVYSWTNVSSTALELGYSSVENTGSTSSADLEKVTLAQEWQAGPGFWARPVIRAYVTSFFGNVAKDAQNKQGVDGDIQVGVQMEAWW
ncbi:maltoporin LamB [Mangrovitalea sediminis]|uniref:maltoporin LamB n=1 Tax=Mangrovitalea sediminis TaxID=1982043 RepID=UPI000BE5177C|nr:maltoporin LamB [Mangrovitalea sediminis]